MAATDTKRIGEAKLNAEFNCEAPYEIVLPPRALTFIEKSISADTDEIFIKFDERRISFNLKNILLISNKFEGKFPTYTVAFKNLPETQLIIDKNSVKDAIRRVALLSEDDDKLIKVKLSESNIIVESLISEGGAAKEVITGFSYDGEDVIFCLNSKLLSSIVNAIETEEISMKFRSNVEPIWIENSHPFDNIEIRYVIMPMRMTRE
jgi:DNA polymerase-3 subunit beta